MNVPGDQVFINPNGNVLGSLTQLISALGAGTTTGIGDAVAAVKKALTNVGQQRVLYAGVVNQIDAQENYLRGQIELLRNGGAVTERRYECRYFNLTRRLNCPSVTILATAAEVVPALTARLPNGQIGVTGALAQRQWVLQNSGCR